MKSAVTVPGTVTVKSLHPRGYEDYDESPPHSSLGMKSPAEFYRDWMLKTGKKVVQF